MISKSRQKLPYRKNCEGYLFYKNKDNEIKVLARDTGKGFLIFPGGGIDNNETPEEALRREALEETGAIVNKLEFTSKLNFDWDENWAKTDKQKERYKQYRGEEMYFFIGQISKLVEPKGDPSDAWKGEKLMNINNAIDKINQGKPFSKDIKKYREVQLKSLERLNTISK